MALSMFQAERHFALDKKKQQVSLEEVRLRNVSGLRALYELERVFQTTVGR